MPKLISVQPDTVPYLLCRCGRASECGLRQTPPKLDETDVEKLWIPVRFLNFIEGSPFLEMKNAGPSKERHDFPDRETAVREYVKEMAKKVKLSKQDTYPEPMEIRQDGSQEN